MLVKKYDPEEMQSGETYLKGPYAMAIASGKLSARGENIQTD